MGAQAPIPFCHQVNASLSVVILASDRTQISLVPLRSQVSPLLPIDDALAIHFIRLAKQFLMVRIRAVHAQRAVFERTVPGIQCPKFLILSPRQQISE